MDVGYYLGELLMQRGEVNVPGLGIFKQVRMSAYYDENENLFYPPYNKVHFEPLADNGNNAELANYLVAKKGISLASAKYFIEKYIGNIKQQAIIADVPLANMGVFYTERAELTFRAGDRLENDAELCGLTPVKIYKADDISAGEEPVSKPELIDTPKPEPEHLVLPPVEEEAEEEIIDKEAEEEIVEEPEDDNTFNPVYNDAFLELAEEEEEEEPRGPLRAILITIIILAVIGGGLFALYRYQPNTFAKLQFWKNNTPDTPVKARPSTIVIPGIDSLHTDSAKTALDSTAKVADSVAVKRVELISGKGFKNLWGANEALKKYRALGLKDARLLEDFHGRLIKISIASFNSISESEAFKQQLIKEGKLTKGAYSIEAPEE